MSINRRRITFSLAANVFFELINKISPFLILYHAHKALGLADFGKAQYHLALLESVQPFIVYGFPNFAMSHGRSDDRQALGGLLSEIFLAKCLNGFLVFVFFLFRQGHNLDPTSMGILLLVLLACILDAYWFCIVQHKLMWIGLAGGIFRLVSLALIWFYVREPSDHYLFVFFSLLPSLFMGFCTGSFALSTFLPVKFNRSTLLSLYAASTPYALLILFTTLLDRLDILLVQYWYGSDISGIYGGPARITLSISMLLSSLALPFFAETRTIDDRQSLFLHSSLSLRLLSLVVAPLIFGLPFTESFVIPYILPQQPDSADGLLSLLSLGLLGSVLLSVFGVQLLLAKGQVWKLIQAVLLGLILSPIFALVFKQDGYFGLGKGVIIGKFLVGITCAFFARSLIGKIPLSGIIKPLCAGAGMAMVLWFFSFENFFKNLFVGGFCYISLLFILYFRDSKALLSYIGSKISNRS